MRLKVSARALVLQHFTSKHYLHIAGVRMSRVTWNHFLLCWLIRHRRLCGNHLLQVLQVSDATTSSAAIGWKLHVRRRKKST